MKPTAPVFLARRSYRLRRMADGMRALPVAGLVLFFLPLLWTGDEDAAKTSAGTEYIFASWAILIVVAGILSRLLRRGNWDGQGEALTPEESAALASGALTDPEA